MQPWETQCITFLFQSQCTEVHHTPPGCQPDSETLKSCSSCLHSISSTKPHGEQLEDNGSPFQRHLIVRVKRLIYRLFCVTACSLVFAVVIKNDLLNHPLFKVNPNFLILNSLPQKMCLQTRDFFYEVKWTTSISNFIFHSDLCTSVSQ